MTKSNILRICMECCFYFFNLLFLLSLLVGCNSEPITYFLNSFILFFKIKAKTRKGMEIRINVRSLEGSGELIFPARLLHLAIYTKYSSGCQCQAN